MYRDIHSHQHLNKYLSNEMVRVWAKSSSFSRGRKKLQAKELNEGRTACALLPAVTMSLVSSPYLRSQPSPRGWRSIELTNYKSEPTYLLQGALARR